MIFHFEFDTKKDATFTLQLEILITYENLIPEMLLSKRKSAELLGLLIKKWNFRKWILLPTEIIIEKCIM